MIAMKKTVYLTILICCFVITACTLKNGKPEQNSIQTPFQSTEWIDEGSKTGVNIDRYLSGMEVIGFSGAIIVSEGDEVVLSKGYGLADRESRLPYKPNTIQTSGSITKQFTGAAILLLESRGELSVSDPITKYFEAVPEDKQDITIHQLLTHSSGLVGGAGGDEDPIEKQPYFDMVMAEPLYFAPGSGFAYSNPGYSLLGMIIEQVSGVNYETFLRNELLLPAGMTNTGYVLPDWSSKNMAVGYRQGEKWGLVYQRGWIEDGPNWVLRANGGLHTTVVDMYNWFRILQGRGVLDEDVVRRWTTGYVTEDNGSSEYGYGWVVYTHDKWGKVITHSGSNRIYEADFVWLPDSDLFFYIHGNSSMVPAASLSGNILAAAFDSTFVMPPIVEMDDTANPLMAQHRAGIYHLDGGYLELTADDTRLVAKLTGQSVFDLMFDHSEKQKERFAELNARTRIAMNYMQAGREDALSGIIHENDDVFASTAPFLRRINQIGNLDSLHVIGTFANAPGSQFHESGPFTTFVYAEFANWNQYWNLVWNEDETYKEDRRGPWPTFILVPKADGQYSGVRHGAPWDIIDIHFEDECMVVAKLHACKEIQTL
jgi:CubicO group peptidase (beta-lactamase class C family)